MDYTHLVYIVQRISGQIAYIRLVHIVQRLSCQIT